MCTCMYTHTNDVNLVPLPFFKRNCIQKNGWIKLDGTSTKMLLSSIKSVQQHLCMTSFCEATYLESYAVICQSSNIIICLGCLKWSYTNPERSSTTWSTLIEVDDGWNHGMAHAHSEFCLWQFLRFPGSRSCLGECTTRAWCANCYKHMYKSANIDHGTFMPTHASNLGFTISTSKS